MAGQWETLAERFIDGRRVRCYVLKRDERGYYFDGLCCASWRRKTRVAVERWAERRGFDVRDVCVDEA